MKTRKIVALVIVSFMAGWFIDATYFTGLKVRSYQVEIDSIVDGMRVELDDIIDIATDLSLQLGYCLDENEALRKDL